MLRPPPGSRGSASSTAASAASRRGTTSRTRKSTSRGAWNDPSAAAALELRGNGSEADRKEEARTITYEDIQQVHLLVETSISHLLTEDETVALLERDAKIQPSFTRIVWNRLEEQNPAFFQSYHFALRRKLQAEELGSASMNMEDAVVPQQPYMYL